MDGWIDSFYWFALSFTRFAAPPLASSHQAKKGPGRPHQPAPQPQPASVTIRDQLNYCHVVIKELFAEKHKSFAWPFHQPVDVVKLRLPDYHNVIKKPMDLGTVKARLEKGLYKSASDFADDVRLVFFNCYRYNPDQDPVVAMAWQTQVWRETVIYIE